MVGDVCCLKFSTVIGILSLCVGDEVWLLEGPLSTAVVPGEVVDVADVLVDVVRDIVVVAVVDLPTLLLTLPTVLSVLVLLLLLVRLLVNVVVVSNVEVEPPPAPPLNSEPVFLF